MSPHVPFLALTCVRVLSSQHLPVLSKLEDIGPDGWSNIDIVFCCLPHATTQEIIAALPKTLKVLFPPKKRFRILSTFRSEIE